MKARLQRGRQLGRRRGAATAPPASALSLPSRNSGSVGKVGLKKSDPPAHDLGHRFERATEEDLLRLESGGEAAAFPPSGAAAAPAPTVA